MGTARLENAFRREFHALRKQHSSDCNHIIRKYHAILRVYQKCSLRSQLRPATPMQCRWHGARWREGGYKIRIAKGSRCQRLKVLYLTVSHYHPAVIRQFMCIYPHSEKPTRYSGICILLIVYRDNVHIALELARREKQIVCRKPKSTHQKSAQIKNLNTRHT